MTFDMSCMIGFCAGLMDYSLARHMEGSVRFSGTLACCLSIVSVSVDHLAEGRHVIEACATGRSRHTITHIMDRGETRHSVESECLLLDCRAKAKT